MKLLFACLAAFVFISTVSAQPPKKDTAKPVQPHQADDFHGTAPASAPYSSIQFDFDSSVLKAESHSTLDATANDLKLTGAKVELDGYASSEGSAAHNMTLAKDRANAVKAYLVNAGVAAKNIKVKAYGETHPIADNSTEDSRTRNRRVEFKKF